MKLSLALLVTITIGVVTAGDYDIDYHDLHNCEVYRYDPIDYHEYEAIASAIFYVASVAREIAYRCNSSHSQFLQLVVVIAIVAALICYIVYLLIWLEIFDNCHPVKVLVNVLEFLYQLLGVCLPSFIWYIGDEIYDNNCLPSNSILIKILKVLLSNIIGLTDDDDYCYHCCH